MIRDSWSQLAAESGFYYIMVWTILEYVDKNGKKPFSKWVSELSDPVQAAIDDRLLKMESQDKWSEKWASGYKTSPKIIELRIPWNKVQYRPLGMYHPSRRRNFVLLHGAIEKGGRIPRPDLEIAEKRRDALTEEPDSVAKYEY